MKKTLLAMLLTGTSMAVFAQTTPTTPPATNTTTDPMSTTTNAQVTTTNAWAPGTSPYWGWNSYGIWDPSINANVTANNGTMATTDANGNLSSTGSYHAYGTSVAALPPNVQMRFDKEFPNTTGTAYSWNQYGDWFQTHYMANGRLTQYYYDTRGNGYSLSLPVIQTYVPEEIIDKALQKYGANLYSVSMVKTAEGKDAYQLGLIDRGQMKMEYLNEDGTAVASVWRVEDTSGAMTTTDANAAMGVQTTTDESMNTTNDVKETKTTWKENGVKTKIKTGEGKVKIKQKKVDD